MTLTTFSMTKIEQNKGGGKSRKSRKNSRKKKNSMKHTLNEMVGN